MTIFTIGFTKKSAEEFFNRLKQAGVLRLIDVRLNNTSQLAGFTKKDDLRYFAHEICGIDYLHLPELAPTQEMLDDFKKRNGDWEAYERRFLDLLRERRVDSELSSLSSATLDHACLLCSEAKPNHCHRRLVAEYLAEKWSGVRIEHLL
jgi:uncharacterized protein (DUF488 family)